MRLFIAINFENIIKDKLYETVQNLKINSMRGNFTHRENLHLTLVFIGETTRTNDIKQAMNKIEANPFDISVGKLGRFKRNNGDVLWIGVEKSEKLFYIYNQLFKILSDNGFNIETREFKPHLTLGREVILNHNFDKNMFLNYIHDINVHINKISLMKSERINGKLTYTEIYNKRLD